MKHLVKNKLVHVWIKKRPQNSKGIFLVYQSTLNFLRGKKRYTILWVMLSCFHSSVSTTQIGYFCSNILFLKYINGKTHIICLNWSSIIKVNQINFRCKGVWNLAYFHCYTYAFYYIKGSCWKIYFITLNHWVTEHSDMTTGNWHVYPTQKWEETYIYTLWLLPLAQRYPSISNHLFKEW